MKLNGRSRSKRASTPAKGAPGPGVEANSYSDFVLRARRVSPAAVEVQVMASPAGKQERPLQVAYSAHEARRLRESFRSGVGWTGSLRNGAVEQSGRMLITQAEATEMGRRLAEVVFPASILQLFCESLTLVVQKPRSGLRLRLVLDASLVDLPWEYLHRPDRPANSGLSGFLLLDPCVSLVRQAADPAIALAPIASKQRLAFFGTLWSRDVDGWGVRGEYDRLCAALLPISSLIAPSFTKSSALADFESGKQASTAIFHYAGHCDFDAHARPYLVREMPQDGALTPEGQVYLEDLAPVLQASGTRLAVMSACNSGFAPAVKPLLDAGIPAIVGVNGAVANLSTIEFCTKLYDSLAVGLSLDEAVARARLHTLEWGQRQQPALFDWGLYMVYMPSPQPVLFPREPTPSIANHQQRVAREHSATVQGALNLARELDGMNFGDIMSELSQRRVLILGRFSKRRLEILEALKRRLAELPSRYQPELFTFDKPKSRDLVESIIGFAALSRFIIADLSEAKSVQSELEAIVPHFLSIPVAPVISRGGRPYATFSSIQRRQNVLKLTRYDDVDDLLNLLQSELVPKAEELLATLRASAS